MMPFSKFFSFAKKQRSEKKKKNKAFKKDTSRQIILPGEHITTQQIGQDPNKSGDPSSSTYQARG